jgi:hypothetical protein
MCREFSTSRDLKMEVMDMDRGARAPAFGAKLARHPQPSKHGWCCKHAKQHHDNVTGRDRRAIDG